MYINSSEITDTRKTLRIYNLYPYIINTVNIYFITSDPALYKDILSPRSDGNAKLIISIDGNKYPLQFNLPGESPNNPIQYTKSLDQAKFSITERNSLDNNRISGFVGSDQIQNWVPGTNVDDIDDFIEIKLEIASLPTQASTRYGYGCSQSLITPDNPIGKYGYGSAQDSNGNIISYGGYGNDFIFKSAAIIVENSQKKKYDYLRGQSAATITSSINGYGDGPYGGDPENGFGQ